MKKLLSLFLAFVMALGITPVNLPNEELEDLPQNAISRVGDCSSPGNCMKATASGMRAAWNIV